MGTFNLFDLFHESIFNTHRNNESGSKSITLKRFKYDLDFIFKRENV